MFHRIRTFISTFLVVVARYIFTDVPVIQTLVHCDVWYVFISYARIYRNFSIGVVISNYHSLVLERSSNRQIVQIVRNFRNKNFFEWTRVSIQRFVHRSDSTPDRSRSCFGHLRLLNRCWSNIAEARVALDSTFSIVPRDIQI